MSLASDIEISPEFLGYLSYILTIENGYVIRKTYCNSCGSLNIKVSAKGKPYCGDICWKNDKKTNADIMSDRCGGDVCCEY